MEDAAPLLRRDRINGRAAALLAALALHLALLTPVVWGLVGRQDEAGFDMEADPLLIPLDIRPSDWPGDHLSRPARQGRTEAAPSVPRPRTTRPREAAPPVSFPASPSGPARPVANPASPAQAGIDDAWRVGGPRSDRAPWGGDVCRDISNLRAWEAANCREHGPTLRAEARGSAPAEIARPEARRGRRPGETAEDDFAEQAAANDAWRAYTRERDAPYPGLRSLLKRH